MARPPCKFGSKCYRVNPEHLKKYSHPTENIVMTTTETIKIKRRFSDEANAGAKKRKHESGSQDTDIRDVVKQAFLVEMPKDFYKFWDFCCSLNPDNPCGALQSDIGLQLVGPYDVMAGKFDGLDSESINYHLHWRYFYDPPEFLTVLSGEEKSGLHVGYFRDDPKEMPSFVASNCVKDGCEIKPLGENVFGAVRAHIQVQLAAVKDKVKCSQLKKVEKLLVSAAEEAGISCAVKKPSSIAKDRFKRVVAKTFHKAGIVVPVDDQDVGYRPLGITDGQLRKMLTDIREASSKQTRATKEDELQELITYVQFANDECDYGMGLELGMDLFCFGEGFEEKAANLLSMAYTLLNRHEFSTIIKTHLKHRTQLCLNQLEV